MCVLFQLLTHLSLKFQNGLFQPLNWKISLVSSGVNELNIIVMSYFKKIPHWI